MNNNNIDKNGKSKLKVLNKQQRYGLYVWQMDHNGKAFGDKNGNVMNIPGNMYDLDKMSNAVHNAYKYITDPNDKEGILMAQDFLQGLWAEGYFD